MRLPNLSLPPQTASQAFQWMFAWGALLVIPAACIAGAYEFRPHASTEQYFLWRQDLPVLAAAAMLLAAVALVASKLPALSVGKWVSGRSVALAALAVFIAGGLGVGLIFQHFTLSMDEVMANFDARIFGRGMVMAPIAPEWRDYAKALQPLFTLNTPGRQYWSSDYLPVNAAFRAAADAVHLRDWLNPLFTAIGIVATYAVGRTLWPDRPRRAAMAALLLATSSQVIIMAMTSYAMPVHLALNMVWLWLFLQRRAWSDALNAPLAFLATGIHQFVFHPLFAGAFILELWLERRWRRAAYYTAIYAVICLFWVTYSGLVFKVLGLTPDQTHAVGANRIVVMGSKLIKDITFGNVCLMADSMIRLVTWQSIALAPLAVVGGAVAIRTAGPLRAMALGIILALATFLILMPSQTHGWGYRYLHGMLGTLSLLAVVGWASLTARLDQQQKAKANTALAALCLLSAVLIIPVRAWQARTFSGHYANTYRALVSKPADFVLVETGTVGFEAGTVVRNDPFLEARPKLFFFPAMTDAQLLELCRRGKVSIFDARDPAAAGILTFTVHDAEAQRLKRARIEAAGCGT